MRYSRLLAFCDYRILIKTIHASASMFKKNDKKKNLCK